jgi:hypothetical protein
MTPLAGTSPLAVLTGAVQDSETLEQITRDVVRTHPDMHFFTGDSEESELHRQVGFSQFQASLPPSRLPQQFALNVNNIQELNIILCHAPGSAGDAPGPLHVCQAQPRALLHPGISGCRHFMLGSGTDGMRDVVMATQTLVFALASSGYERADRPSVLPVQE